MAYVLFAISALMIAFGVYSLVTGYPVVQVEEGWTAVISGSTFIVGGIVTAALGLVLRVLMQVRDGLLADRAAPAEGEAPAVKPDAAALPPEFVDQATAEPEAAPPEPLSAPAIASTAPTAVDRSSNLESAAAAPVAWASASRIEEAWRDEAPAHRPEENPTPIHDPGPDLDLAPPAPPVEPTVHEPAPNKETLLVPRAAPPVPPDLPRAPPDIADAPPVAPDLDPEPEPAHAPQETVASAKVIGRYEADGTSYVMYADGSIEAQTESGVYRFASMAELKSFIET